MLEDITMSPPPRNADVARVCRVFKNGKNSLTSCLPALRKCVAFTLAEVLVTLGIIGVVSAMTLPTLVKNHQRKVFVTQLHKVYNEVQQAFELYMNDRNAVNLLEAGFTSESKIDAFVNKYFKVVKTCSVDDELLPCFASEYSDLEGNEGDVASESDCFKAYVLASGATICFSSGNIGQINVDINGTAEPNIAGRDLFYMGWVKDGTLDEYFISDINGNYRSGDVAQLREDAYAQCKNSGTYAVGCFGKILNDGWEMNY